MKDLGYLSNQRKGDIMTVREIRNRSGLTREAFCRLVGVKWTALQNYERGRCDCPQTVLARCLTVLQGVIELERKMEG